MASPFTIPSQEFFDRNVTGSVRRRLGDKDGDIVSVLDFTGADPTGATSSSAAFQAAHDSLPSTGGAILIPPGTYTLAATVNISKTDVLISGASGTVLINTGLAAASPMFNVTAAGRVLFEQMQVKNTRHGRGPLFYFNTVARVSGVQRVYINGQDFYTIGVYFYSGSYSCFVRDVSMVSMGRGIGVLSVSQTLNLSSVRIDGVTVDFGTGFATNVNTTPDTLLDNISVIGLHVQAQSESGTLAATTLNGSILSGVTSLVVTSAAGMAIGNQILIGDGTLMEHNKITDIAGTTITLQFATVGAYANGKRVLAANLFGAIMGVNTSSTTLENFHAEIVGLPILGAENEEMIVINPQLTSYVDGIRLDPVLEFTLIGGDFGPSWTSGVHITNRVGGWGTVSARQVLLGSMRLRDADATKLILDDRAGAGTAPQVFTARFDNTNQIATNTLTVNTNHFVGTDATGAFITQRGPTGYGAALVVNRNGSTVWQINDVSGFPTFTKGVSVGTDAGAAQNGHLFMGSGVPNNANGSNGDFYFRTDTPGTVNQRLYQRSAGAWVALAL